MKLNILDIKEELLPELKAHLTRHRTLNMIIQHPLVFSVPHNDQMNAYVNERFRIISKEVRNALELKNYDTYIWLHERPYRLQAFSNVYDKMTNEQYWKSLASLWIDSENIWQNKQYWKSYLSDRKESKHLFMSEEDKTVFDELPEQFTVYRGYVPKKNKLGFSYTLSEEKAEWFAKRFNKDGLVLKLLVNKKDIFAYTNQRDEQEIIILNKHIK